MLRVRKPKPLPLYEYSCHTCSQKIELLIRGDEKPKCPDCQSVPEVIGWTDLRGLNGGRFTVKKYHSELFTDLAVTADGWQHTPLQMLPVNPAFEAIEIEAEAAGDVVIVGGFAVLIPQS